MGIRQQPHIKILRSPSQTSEVPMSKLPRWKLEDLKMKVLLEDCKPVELNSQTLEKLAEFVRKFSGKQFRTVDKCFVKLTIPGLPPYKMIVRYAPGDEKEYQVSILNSGGWQRFYKADFNHDGEIVGQEESYSSFYSDLFKRLVDFSSDC